MTCKPTEPCYIFAGRLRTMSNEMDRLGRTLPGGSVAGVTTKTTLSPQKRTVAEAMQRANEAGSPLWRATRTIPFLRPYGIALQALTYGLIMVDPLDRLDGGLID